MFSILSVLTLQRRLDAFKVVFELNLNSLVVGFEAFLVDLRVPDL